MGCAASSKKHGDVYIESENKPNGPLGRSISRERYYESHHVTNKPPKTEFTPKILPKSEDCKTEDEKKILKLLNVDLKIDDNTKHHKTDQYELTQSRVENGVKIQPQLIVRRGQPFDILIDFDRAFNKETDDLRLIFIVSNKARESKGTKIVMTLSEEDGPRQWGAKVSQYGEKNVSLKIYTPPNCIVAKWTMEVDVVFKKKDVENVFRYKPNVKPIYCIFNPWLIEDAVYLEDESFRQEYVLNDKGRLYRGTNKQISSKPWNFGQFEDCVLEVAMSLLDRSELSYRVRGSPVHVSRKISSLVNAPDDGGILVGNWSGDYAGGRSPLSWIGSVEIIQEYHKTHKPVKYGQCWVFSGLTTTVCRALGIPCRSVTNFSSAHDTDGSITVDNHWNDKGEPEEHLNIDSVWNFHVWNEAWMTRPDLPPGFGGWQAIDSTPQETSEGLYCCGPVSLEALKNGLVNLPYDGPFIFAEVNADRVHWIADGEAWKNVKQPFSIGKCISTKAASTDERQDITHMYKFAEGTPQERTAVWRAVREGSTRQDVYSVAVEDMNFEMVEKEQALIGEAFGVILKAINKSSEERNIKATLTASIVYYTGTAKSTIKTASFNIKAAPNSTGEVNLPVTYKEYCDLLVDMCLIKMSVMVSVVETKQFYCSSDTFRLLKPRINIQVPEQVNEFQDYVAELSFKNPLPKALTRCEFTVEGAGLQQPLKIKYSTIGPHVDVKTTVALKAKKAGEREIIVGFDSKEITDCTGTAKVKIIPSSG